MRRLLPIALLALAPLLAWAQPTDTQFSDRIERPRPNEWVQILTPSDDAHARDANPDTNYDGDPRLIMRETAAAGTVDRAYIQFDLSAIPADLRSPIRTRLRLYHKTTATPDSVFMRHCTGTIDEATLTWNTRPACETPIVNKGFLSGSVSETVINVPDSLMLEAFAGDLTLTLELRVKTEDNGSNNVQSKEGVSKPQLLYYHRKGLSPVRKRNTPPFCSNFPSVVQGDPADPDLTYDLSALCKDVIGDIDSYAVSASTGPGGVCSIATSTLTVSPTAGSGTCTVRVTDDSTATKDYTFGFSFLDETPGAADYVTTSRAATLALSPSAGETVEEQGYYEGVRYKSWRTGNDTSYTFVYDPQYELPPDHGVVLALEAAKGSEIVSDFDYTSTTANHQPTLPATVYGCDWKSTRIDFYPDGAAKNGGNLIVSISGLHSDGHEWGADRLRRDRFAVKNCRWKGNNTKAFNDLHGTDARLTTVPYTDPGRLVLTSMRLANVADDDTVDVALELYGLRPFLHPDAPAQQGALWTETAYPDDATASNGRWLLNHAVNGTERVRTELEKQGIDDLWIRYLVSEKAAGDFEEVFDPALGPFFDPDDDGTYTQSGLTTYRVTGGARYEFWGTTVFGDRQILAGAGGAEVTTATGPEGETYNPVRLKDEITLFYMPPETVKTYALMSLPSSDPDALERDAVAQVRKGLTGFSSTSIAGGADAPLELGFADFVWFRDPAEAFKDSGPSYLGGGGLPGDLRESLLRNAPGDNVFDFSPHGGKDIPLDQLIALDNIAAFGYSAAGCLGSPNNTFVANETVWGGTRYNHNVYNCRGKWRDITYTMYEWDTGLYPGEHENFVVERTAQNPYAWRTSGGGPMLRSDATYDAALPYDSPYTIRDDGTVTVTFAGGTEATSGEVYDGTTTFDIDHIDVRGQRELGDPTGFIYGSGKNPAPACVDDDTSNNSGCNSFGRVAYVWAANGPNAHFVGDGGVGGAERAHVYGAKNYFQESTNGFNTTLYPNLVIRGFDSYLTGRGAWFDMGHYTRSTIKEFSEQQLAGSETDSYSALWVIDPKDPGGDEWHTPRSFLFKNIDSQAPRDFVFQTNVGKFNASVHVFLDSVYVNNQTNRLLRSSRTGRGLFSSETNIADLNLYWRECGFDIENGSFEEMELFFEASYFVNCTEEDGLVSEQTLTFSGNTYGGLQGPEQQSNLFWQPYSNTIGAAGDPSAAVVLGGDQSAIDKVGGITFFAKDGSSFDPRNTGSGQDRREPWVRLSMDQPLVSNETVTVTVKVRPWPRGVSLDADADLTACTGIQSPLVFVGEDGRRSDFTRTLAEGPTLESVNLDYLFRDICWADVTGLAPTAGAQTATYSVAGNVPVSASLGGARNQTLTLNASQAHPTSTFTVTAQTPDGRSAVGTFTITVN